MKLMGGGAVVVFREKGCPKCKGDVWLDQDEYGWYEQCIMCGYLCNLEGIRYIDGVESVVVTPRQNAKVYPFHAVIESLKTATETKVEEAKEYIITELSGGELERRQLGLRMRARGILKYPFDIALKELKMYGRVVARAASKGNRGKLALVT